MNLNPEKDALAAELADSDESYKYINYLVVKEGNEESPKTKALIAALENDDVKNYIEEKYSGSVSRCYGFLYTIATDRNIRKSPTSECYLIMNEMA